MDGAGRCFASSARTRWARVLLARTRTRAALATVFALGLLLCMLPGQALAAQRVWDGGSAIDSDWTTPENWQGDVAPSANDDLAFPAGGARLTNNNSFAALTEFRSIAFSGSGYTLQGAPIELGVGGISSTNDSGLNVVQLDVLCTASQSFNVPNAGATLRFSGAVGAGLVTLTLDGDGDLEFTARGNSGTIVKNGSGTVSYMEHAPDVNLILNAGTLGGTGTIGNVSETSGMLGPGASPGILTLAGDLTTGAGTIFNFELWGLNPGPPTGYDQVRVGER